MTDKYEEFKKWVDNKFPTPSKSEQIMGIDWERIFNDFEEEQEEKQKEKEIKLILEKHFPSVIIETEFGQKSNLINASINDCYEELKEKGYLK